MILIHCWKVHATISCNHIFKITNDTVNFSFVQIMTWLLSYIFEIFIVFDIRLFSSIPTNVLQFCLLQFFVIIHDFYQCITVIMMMIQNCLTKKQLRTVTLCFRAFSSWFWYFSEHIRQIFDIVILLKSRIIPQFLMLM